MKGLEQLPGLASKYAKEGLKSLNNPYADAASQLLSDVGAGRSGGKKRMQKHLL
jgi:hypothetical protein